MKKVNRRQMLLNIGLSTAAVAVTPRKALPCGLQELPPNPNPKGLPVLKAGVHFGSRRFLLTAEEQDALFAGVPWTTHQVSPKWFHRSVRAWLPKEYPISNLWGTEHYYGEVEVTQETCPGYPGNGTIRRVPESIVVKVEFAHEFFTVEGSGRDFGEKMVKPKGIWVHRPSRYVAS